MNSVGTSVFAAAFWGRVALAAVYVAVPALLVAASVWWATRRIPRDSPSAAAPAAHRARRGRLVGLGVGALAGVLSIWLDQGLLAPALVGVGYLFGTLGELLSAPAPRGTVRTAVVTARVAGRYVPRWAVRVAVATGAVCVVTPLLFAVLPRVSYLPWSPDGTDHRFTLPGGTLSWPSVATSVPLAAIAAAGLVVGNLFARRVALTPPMAADPAVDEQIRRRIGRAGAGAVIGIELLVLAVSAIAASGGLAVPYATGGLDYVMSRSLVWAGFCVAACALLAWCVLGSRPLPRAQADDA